MPLFEYRCDECTHLYEELITGNREKTVPCPSCGSTKTKKIMSAIGGISMGKSSGAPVCASSCAGASSCGSGGCPHGM